MSEAVAVGAPGISRQVQLDGQTRRPRLPPPSCRAGSARATGERRLRTHRRLAQCGDRLVTAIACVAVTPGVAWPIRASMVEAITLPSDDVM